MRHSLNSTFGESGWEAPPFSVALLTTIDHAVAGTSASFYFEIMLRGVLLFCPFFTVISARGVFVEPSHHKFDIRRLQYNRTQDGKNNFSDVYCVENF